MNRKQNEIQILQSIIENYGYPKEFGVELSRNLKSEKAIRRMNAYLRQAKPQSVEEIVDEMIAIVEEHSRWRQKKITEYNNAKYNELLLHGLEDDEEW